jgi:pimeloyl-ACP methyl ester carboxylesterase
MERRFPFVPTRYHRGRPAGGYAGPVGLELPDPRTIDLDGPVAYRTWDGPSDPTFVLVHGLGGASINWARVAPGLSGLGRVLAIDLPGFGGTPRAGRGSRMMDLRRTLSRFIEATAEEPVVLCGNSMGGGVSILEAAVAPDQVAGMVLTSSVFPWVRGGFPHPLVMASFAAYRIPAVGEEIAVARLASVGPERALRISFRFTLAEPGSLPPEVILLHEDQLRARGHDPDAVAAFIETARSLMRLGTHPDAARRALDNVRCPVLVIHGRQDRLVPAAFAEAELRRHPAWRGRILPRIGHLPMLEAPGRWLTEVADWYPRALS